MLTLTLTLSLNPTLTLTLSLTLTRRRPPVHTRRRLVVHEHTAWRGLLGRRAQREYREYPRLQRS